MQTSFEEKEKNNAVVPKPSGDDTIRTPVSSVLKVEKKVDNDPNLTKFENAETDLNFCLHYEAKGNQKEAICSLKEELLSLYTPPAPGEHDPNVAKVLSLLGLVFFDQGNFDIARTHCLQALEMFEEGTKNLTVAEINYCLGVIHHNQANFSQALMNFEHALTLFRFLNKNNTNTLKIAGILHKIGQLYQLENNNPYALAYFQSALNTYNLIDSDEKVNHLADIHRRMGEIYLIDNNQTSAQESLSQALAMYQQMHTQNFETIATIEALLIEISRKTPRKIVLEPITTMNPMQMDSAQPPNSTEKQRIDTGSDRACYGSFQEHSNHSDSPRSDSGLTAQFESNKNKESMLAYLCNCCGLFGSRSTKKQGSPLSDSLANEIPRLSGDDSFYLK